MFLIVTASILMPFPITCLAVFMLMIYAVVNNEARHEIIKTKGIIILMAFSALVLIVPALYGRWISFVAGIIIIIILIFFIYAQSIMTYDLYNKSIDIVCMMSVLCFVIAVCEKIIIGVNHRSTAWLLNANYYGTIIEFVVLLCVYRLVTNSQNAKLYITLIVMNVIGLFLCDCQSAWLAIIAGVLVILFFNGYIKYGVIFLAISILFVAGGIIIPGILPRMVKMPETFSTRLNIWQTALKGIKDHPFFGQGPLTYLFSCHLYGGYKTYHAHSVYLDPLLSHGIVGVGVIITYIVTLIKQAVKNTVHAQSCAVNSLMLAVATAVCVHGVTDFSIFWVQTGMLLFVIMSGVAIKYTKAIDNVTIV